MVEPSDGQRPLPREHGRRYAPAAERNREPILAVLRVHLPRRGTVLEIASGTGQHAVHCAPALAPRHWLTSDPNPAARASIAAWLAAADADNLHGPLTVDVTEADWPQAIQTWRQAHDPVPPVTAVVAINLIHISPWAACEGLIQGAAMLLPVGGVLYLYGPYYRQGATAPSNEAFDASLRAQDPNWGVRELETVVALTAQHQFSLTQVIEMPANNLSVLFQKT
jgi:SAM-dependent methyltransferase